MKLERVNNLVNQESQVRLETNKEVDYRNMVNQDNQIKVKTGEDSLEMGDLKSKDKFNDFSSRLSKGQMEVLRREMANSWFKRYENITENIYSLTREAASGEIKVEDRKKLQFTIDDLTRDLKSIANNFKRELGEKFLSPEDLSLKGEVNIAKLGKVTVKSRTGRAERISVSYTGKENRTIKIDPDQNNGRFREGLKFYELKDGNKAYKNREFKEILESSGYLVDIEEGFEEDDLLPMEISFKRSGEFAGLSVMTIRDSLESAKKLEEARERLKGISQDFKLDADRLEFGFIRDIFQEDSLLKLQDAKLIMEKVKNSIIEDKKFEEYLYRSQNPEIVYRLLR